MSKFIDAVRSDSPEHLWAFNLDATAISGGVLPDLGYGGVVGAIVANDGVSMIAVDPIISGESYANHVENYHERGVNSSVQNVGYINIGGGIADKYFGPVSIENWTMECVVSSNPYNRAKFSYSALLFGTTSISKVGLEYNYNSSDDTRSIAFALSVDGVDTTALESMSYSSDTTLHIAVVKTDRFLSLLINGTSVDTYEIPVDAVLDDLTSSTFKLGGWNSREHADAIIGAIALYERALSTEAVKSHSDKVVVDDAFESTVQGFSPELLVTTELGDLGANEPHVESLSNNADHTKLYENPTSKSLSISDENLGSGSYSTSSKLKVLDTSGLSAGVSTKFEYETTTDANSSITPEYAVEDGAYTTLTQGQDTIPELNAFRGRLTGNRYEEEVLADSPIAYFKFAGDGTNDGSGADATVVSVTFDEQGLTSSPDYIAGNFQADGSKFGLSTMLSSQANLTLSIWFKPTRIAPAKNNIMEVGATGIGTQCYLNPDMTIGVYQSTPGILMTSTKALEVGKTYMITVTHTNAEKARLYINGVLETEMNVTTTSGGSSPGAIGNSAGGAEGDYTAAFGVYDDFAGYNTPLPSERVYAHYRAGIEGGNLYRETDFNGNYVLQGETGGISTVTPRNLLPIDMAIATGGLSTSGTEMVSLGFIEPPEFASTGTVADSAINAGVFGVEWTGTSTSEQITTLSSAVQIQSGMTLDAGAWVYLEADGPRDIGIRWVAFDSASTTENSGFNYVEIQPEAWTYISQSGVVGNAGSIRAAVYIEANGNQQIGDKLYVGATFLGMGGPEWCHPITPASQTLDFRFDAKILNEGPILSSGSYDGLTDGESFHIEAYNGGFHVQTGTKTGAGVKTLQTYTTSSDIYKYGTWYTFRWAYDKDAGEHRFYVLDLGRWKEIDFGVVNEKSAEFFITSYGISTLETGLLTGGPNVYINNFGMSYIDEYDWEVNPSEIEDTALDVIGSSIDLGNDTGTGVNENFFAPHNGWILGPNATLLVEEDANYDFGSSDFTVMFDVLSPSTTDGAVFSKGGQSGVEVSVDTGTTTPSIWIAGTEFNPTTALFDGSRHVAAVQRTAGTTVDFYVDEFFTPADTFTDTAGDPTNTSQTFIGARDVTDSTTSLSGIIGCYVVFTRVLEDSERDELGLWIDSGSDPDNEPAWLRTEADLYINSSDPVQVAESRRNGRVINLAVAVPDSISVRYTFTSDDGISNPELTKNYLSVGNLLEEDGNTSYLVQKFAPVPVKVSALGLPHTSYLTDGDLLWEVDRNVFSEDWLNQSFTLAFWFKNSPEDTTTTERVIASQGSTGKRLIVAAIQNGANSSLVVKNDTTTLITTAASDYTDRMHLGVLTSDGVNYTLYVDAVQVGTSVVSDLSGMTEPLYIAGGPGLQGFVGQFSTFVAMSQHLTAQKVRSLYASGPASQDVNFTETFSVTTSISHQSINWERA